MISLEAKKWIIHQLYGLIIISLLSIFLALSSNSLRKEPVPWIDKPHILKAGDSFPYVPLPTTKMSGDLTYLGLPQNKEMVTIEDIQADLLVLEVLNAFCFPCQTQALSLSKVYKMIEKNPELKGKIKILGVALGNTKEVVEGFMKDYELGFPVIPDPTARGEKIIGPGIHTPFSLFIKRDAQGKLRFVAATHNGAIDDPQTVFRGLVAILKLKPGIANTENLFEKVK